LIYAIRNIYIAVERSPRPRRLPLDKRTGDLEVDVNRIDLRLLYTLETIHRMGTLTAAGEALGLSQPALSHSLNRLRDMFGDELFVRTSRGMRSTPRADELANSARRILATVRAELSPLTPLEPETLDRSFRLAMTDVGEMVFLPRLIEHLRNLAPKVNIVSVTLPPRDLADALELGTVDMAIGPFPDLTGADLRQQVIFERGFVCLVSSNHPRITKGRMTLNAFLKEPHLVVSSPGRTVEVFERFMAERELSRRVALSVPHMLCVPFIVANSDLIATVPESVGMAVSDFPELQVIKPPLEAPRIRVALYWSVRFGKEPGNAWLRSVITELFCKDKGHRPLRPSSRA
jgi:DNA-binding transcriptional LysR family regulator